MARRIWLVAGSAAAALLAGVGSAAAQAPAATPAPTSAGPASGGAVSEVVVTATRLNAARDSIQPQIGASTYSFSEQNIQALPGGENLQLSQIILQAPGVAQDSYGQLHIRGDHNGLQYRLNGVILPEGLSVFGQSLNPRLAESVQLITGALPAQYGLRTAGIIDIRTKSGISNGGDISIYGGSHETFQPSVEYGATSGNLSMFVSGDYLQNHLGLESPDGKSDPTHDKTEQWHGFGYFEDILSNSDKLSAIVGVSATHFQIPNVDGEQPGLGLAVNGQTGFASDNLNEQQRETTNYAVASWLHDADKWTTQVSLLARYSTLDYTPDQLGELLYNGIAQGASKTDTAGGLQAEGVYRLTDAHTLRGGVIVEVDRSTSATNSQVLPIDGGVQTTDVPQAILDSGAKTASTYSVYAQDEWKLLSNLTLNYGLRFDEFDGFRSENQFSPRVNLVWNATGSTTVHIGYSRFFTPPPFELIASTTVSKFAGTTAAQPGTLDTTPYAERDNYYDGGVSQKLFPGMTAGLDIYYKDAQHLIDEGQFGAPIILTPFNYNVGKVYGAELTTSYTHGPFSAYANLAYSHAQGEDIISSQFNFDPADLAYIQNHFIFLDHDQRWSGTLGASYAFPEGTRAGFDLLYGTGLRKDSDVPNGGQLSTYTQVNLSISHTFQHLTPGGPIEVRFDVINLFDDDYEIRDGTGVGVGAPQFGPRRGFFAGLKKSF